MLKYLINFLGKSDTVCKHRLQDQELRNQYWYKGKS